MPRFRQRCRHLMDADAADAALIEAFILRLRIADMATLRITLLAPPRYAAIAR